MKTKAEVGKRKAEPGGITTLAPWFGGSRFLAPKVGKMLAGCSWVGIPFAGGMPEVAHIHASTIVVNDLHRHVMNLACVVSSHRGVKRLAGHLSKLPFHPDVLAEAQRHCMEMERAGFTFGDGRGQDLSERWALNYFITVWMGRSGNAGTENEFYGGLPVRWNANGGDSNTRFRSAVASLMAWHEIMARCNFLVQDCFEFLGNVQDSPRHGLYCDPPFPDCGVKYRHSFTDDKHRQLARMLAAFEHVKVVCRFYDHPLVRELYPETRWTWHHFTGRKQNHAIAPEVLLLNGF